MKNSICIRHEDKYVMERRVPVVPAHVKKLVNNGIEVEVVTSPKRVFKDEEYRTAGATIVEKPDRADVIFGVKEIPMDFFEKNKSYIFFSHVIKGQPYNMPMLKKMMELKCHLIDYEKVADDKNRRLIFFGRFAGLAGMINSLWSLGQRLKEMGTDNIFTTIRQSHTYDSLEEAKRDIAAVGEKIRKNGLPKELKPLVIGFTGYGNVSNGAQEIADLLPFKEISPEELLSIDQRDDVGGNHIFKVVFKEEDISEPLEKAGMFNLQDYYDNPQKYSNKFEQYVPHLTILMNCMYWDDRYPRIVTKDYLEQLFSNGAPRLKVIGDVTCDPDGSIECTHKGTEIEEPVFVYNPATRKPLIGFQGDGILVMAVDILPSELPRESSIAFSDALFEFVEPIAKADFSAEFDNLELPPPIKKAMILHKGKLTPDYEYITDFLK